MHVRLRVRRWVAWCIYIGIACGAVALVNIVGHHLTGTQDRILIIIGATHWVLGGIVCWAFEGVKIESRRPSPTPPIQESKEATEYHPASDFLLPGSRHSLLPWRH